MTFRIKLQEAIQEVDDQCVFLSDQFQAVSDSYQKTSLEIEMQEDPLVKDLDRLEGLSVRLDELATSIRKHVTWKESIEDILTEIKGDTPPPNS